MALMGLSDEALGILVPMVIFWCYSGMYEVVGNCFLGKYRLFPREEEEGKNLITKWEAIRGILINQAFQLVFSFLFLWLQGNGRSAPIVQPPLYVQAVQLLVAILVLDIWQYFGHRLFHANRFLYKQIHALHHHIIVPYAFGAQYQHPLEALLLDGFGAILAYTVSGLTPRTAAFFLSLTLVKSIDDHCGLWLPGHPFHLVFSNNSAFHTVHHQLYGGKANFSAPYFTFWDKIMGTYMPYTMEEKAEGGYELKPLKATVKED